MNIPNTSQFAAKICKHCYCFLNNCDGQDDPFPSTLVCLHFKPQNRNICKQCACFLSVCSGINNLIYETSDCLHFKPHNRDRNYLEHSSNEYKYFPIKEQAEINDLASNLAYLLMLNNPCITSSNCTGKWEGTCDFSLTYDGGYLLINNIDNLRPVGERIEMIKSGLSRLFDKYSYLISNRYKIMYQLKKRQQLDNALAAELGLKPYSLKEVKIITKNHSHCGWACLTLEVDGHEFTFIETSLSFDLCNHAERLQFIDNDYYIAHGGKTADFVYNGIGHAVSNREVTNENCLTVISTRSL